MSKAQSSSIMLNVALENVIHNLLNKTIKKHTIKKIRGGREKVVNNCMCCGSGKIYRGIGKNIVDEYDVNLRSKKRNSETHKYDFVILTVNFCPVCGRRLRG